MKNGFGASLFERCLVRGRAACPHLGESRLREALKIFARFRPPPEPDWTVRAISLSALFCRHCPAALAEV